MKNIDVTALGELLIDFTENGLSEQGNQMFEANPGGAPCNVLAMLTKLGHKTAFIGKVGRDYLGNTLKDKVSGLGIETSGLYQDENVHTTLAFVHTFPGGDRDFSFYRNPGADMMLDENEVDVKRIQDSKIFHFGTLSMTHEGVRRATMKAIDVAKEAGSIVSFDPNIREPLWNDMNECRKQIEYGMSKCDVLKISDNEIQWFTGENDFTEGVKIIKSQYNIQLILVSMGKEGSRAYYDDMMVEVPSIIQEKTIETTGAGDTFGACVLHYVLAHGLENLSEKMLKEMLTFANAAASIVTTRKGALCVMPSKEEVDALVATINPF